MIRYACLFALLFACSSKDEAALDAEVDGATDATLDAGIDAALDTSPPVMQPVLTQEWNLTRVRPPYESEAACRTANPEGRCVQQLVLCPNGQVTLYLTSDRNTGAYALRDTNRIEATLTPPGPPLGRFGGTIDSDAGTFVARPPTVDGGVRLDEAPWQRIVGGDAVCSAAAP